MHTSVALGSEGSILDFQQMRHSLAAALRCQMQVPEDEDA